MAAYVFIRELLVIIEFKAHSILMAACLLHILSLIYLLWSLIISFGVGIFLVSRDFFRKLFSLSLKMSRYLSCISFARSNISMILSISIYFVDDFKWFSTHSLYLTTGTTWKEFVLLVAITTLSELFSFLRSWRMVSLRGFC